jgi:hypothetical protein
MLKTAPQIGTMQERAQKTGPHLAHGGILPDKIPQDQPCSRTEFRDF